MSSVVIICHWARRTALPGKDMADPSTGYATFRPANARTFER